LQSGTLWCVGASLTALARARTCPNVAELDGGSPTHVVAKLREALGAPSGMPAAR